MRDELTRTSASMIRGDNPKRNGKTTSNSKKNMAGNKALATRALKLVVEAFQHVSDQQAKKVEDWKDLYSAYRTQPKKTIYQGRAKIAVPAAFKAVETIHADLMEGTFGQERWFRCDPRLPEYDRYAEQIEGVLRYDIERSNFMAEYDDVLKSAEILGTGVGKCFWRWPTKRQQQMRRQSFQIGETTVERDLLSDESDNSLAGPCLKHVFLDDFFVADPLCPDVQEQPFVLERSLVTEPQARELANKKVWLNVDQIRKMQETAEWVNYHSESAELMNERLAVQGITDRDWVLNLYEKPTQWVKFEFWGLFDIEKEGVFEECLITVVNMNTVVRLQRNPHWRSHRPYIAIPYSNDPGMFHGIGIVEPIRYVYQELNAKRAQQLDSITFALNPMWFAGVQANLRQKHLVSAPGRVVPVVTVNEIKQMETDTRAISMSMGMEEVIRRDIEESTGATPIMSGMGSAPEKATVFTGMVERAGARLKMVLRRQEERGIKPAINQFWWLEQQYRKEAVASRILGRSSGGFSLVQPEQMKGDYVFVPQGSLHMSATFTRNAGMLQFFQMFGGALQQRPDLIWKMMRDVYQNVLNLPNAERYFPDDPYVKFADPEAENYLLMNGAFFPANQGEDHQAHIQKHLEHRENPHVIYHLETHIQMAGQGAQAAGTPFAQPGSQQNQASAEPYPAGPSQVAGGRGDGRVKAQAEMPSMGMQG